VLMNVDDGGLGSYKIPNPSRSTRPRTRYFTADDNTPSANQPSLRPWNFYICRQSTHQQHSQNASTIPTAGFAATNSFRGCSTANSTRLRSNCNITKGFSLCLIRPVLLRLGHTRHYIKSNRQRMQTHAKRAKKAVARID